MNEMDRMARYIQERNRVLLSMDMGKIKFFMRKYDMQYPNDDKEFWINVHYARLQVESFSEEVKQVSREYLDLHGIEYEESK